MLFPILYLSERIKKGGGEAGIFDLGACKVARSLRGCAEPASQARGLAWILEPGM